MTFTQPEKTSFEVELEVLLGTAEAYLYRNSDNKVLFEHPCPMNATHHVKNNLVKFKVTSESTPELFTPVIMQGLQLTPETLTLKIVATSEIFEGVAYLRTNESLNLITDGHPKEFDFALYAKNKPQYFLYLPSTHEFDL